MIRAIGHRGAMLDRVENTLPAFHEAVRQGATALELDVQRACSGEVVVFHDAMFDRLGGTPRRAADMTLAEMRQVVLRDPGLPGQTGRVHTFEEVLSDAVLAPLLSDRSRPFDLFVELKVDDLEADVAAAVRSHGLVDRVFLISFRRHRLERVRALGRDLRTSLLFPDRRDENLRVALDIGCTALNPEPYDADAGFVDRARNAGLLVTVGQTSDPGVIRPLLDLDVWGIHSDRPALIVQALAQKPT